MASLGQNELRFSKKKFEMFEKFEMTQILLMTI